MKLIEDLDLYSKLLMSVKPAIKTNDRPLSPIEASDLIERLIFELDSEIEAMVRLDIKKDMLSAFRSLQDAPPEYKHAIVWGSTNDQGISFSSAHQIIRMKSDNEEKKILFESSIKHGFNKNEISSIVALKNREQGLGIYECIEKVKRIRPTVESHYIVILPIIQNLNWLKKIAKENNVPLEKLINNLILKVIPKEHIFMVSSKNNYVTMSLDKNGNQILLDLIKIKRLMVNEILQYAHRISD